MTGATNIEWTDKTWNPVVGCSVVSPGCTNCYAMKFAGNRLDENPNAPHYAGTTMRTKAGPVWTGKVTMAPDHILTAPLRWRKPAMIFVNSMGDLFHEDVPDAWIDRIFAIMALTPQHIYQVLTKRAERMKAYMSKSRAAFEHRLMETGFFDFLDLTWPLPNVWLGVSTEDQARADERIPHLLETPAAVRFISAEPLLGPIDLTEIVLDGWSTTNALKRYSWREIWENSWSPEVTGEPLEECKEAYLEEGGVWPPTDDRPRGLDWVIAGGESGPGARPMHPDWVRSLRDQCAAAGIPFFFKQWGDWLPMGQTMADGSISALDKGERPGFWDASTLSARVGKKAAGHLLDGVAHRAFPEAAT